MGLCIVTSEKYILNEIFHCDLVLGTTTTTTTTTYTTTTTTSTSTTATPTTTTVPFTRDLITDGGFEANNGSWSQQGDI